MDASNSSIALEIATGASFVLFAGAFWIVFSLGQWAIAPVDQLAAAALSARVRTHFSLREILLLVVQLQFAFGLSLILGAAKSSWVISACTLIGCGLAAIWWLSLRRLAIGGVVDPQPRLVMLAIVTPLKLAAIVGGLWFNGRAVVEIVQCGDFVTTPWLLGNMACGGAFLVCRRLALWVTAPDHCHWNHRP